MTDKKPVTPKPSWLKVRAPTGQNYTRIKEMLGDLNLATVCQEARYPANELNQKNYKMTTQEGKELSQNGN